mmetsp:Transcript_5952/g.12458  ORF Transcript_5952/g.12458 Transcript_5952/m.12458 type:complete len:276 (+) Transcript_5952:68-895(+)
MEDLLWRQKIHASKKPVTNRFQSEKITCNITLSHHDFSKPTPMVLAEGLSFTQRPTHGQSLRRLLRGIHWFRALATDGKYRLFWVEVVADVVIKVVPAGRTCDGHARRLDGVVVGMEGLDAYVAVLPVAPVSLCMVVPADRVVPVVARALALSLAAAPLVLVLGVTHPAPTAVGADEGTARRTTESTERSDVVAVIAVVVLRSTDVPLVTIVILRRGKGPGSADRPPHPSKEIPLRHEGGVEEGATGRRSRLPQHPQLPEHDLSGRGVVRVHEPR